MGQPPIGSAGGGGRSCRVCSAVWVPVNCGCGTGRAERPGRSPRGVRGHAPAGVAGQGGSRRFWVTHWEPSSGYIESRGGEVPPERDRTVPGGTQPDTPSGCLDPGAEFKPPLRWTSPCWPAVPRARDRAGAVNRDSGPHARGLSRPPVHDHTSYPRRTGRGARVRDQPTGHRPGLNGGGCPPSRSRHGTCDVCTRRGVFRSLTG